MEPQDSYCIRITADNITTVFDMISIVSVDTIRADLIILSSVSTCHFVSAQAKNKN
jgi:hypothetical protein